MQKNNVPIPGLLQHPGLHNGGIMDSPVLGVHRPLDNGHFQCLGHLSHGLGAAASRGPEQLHPGPLRQQGQGTLNLLIDIPAAHSSHGVVGKAVAADLMALLCDPLCQFRILPDAVAAEEEGSFYIPFRQPIQQRPGESPGGAIVKGQCHSGRSGIHRKHQQKAQKQRRENFSHKTHLLRKRLGLTGGGKWGMI